MSLTKSRLSKKESASRESKREMKKQEKLLTRSFLEAMTADFSQHGVETIRKIREEKPEQYLRLVSLTLNQENISNDRTKTDDMDHLTDKQLLELIDALEEEMRLFTGAEKESRAAGSLETTLSSSTA
ncbi:hypothetical protein [Liberibacter crescens]|nr:hypothetical protein [Liberibacter crescens]